MPYDQLHAASTIVAYQSITLTELQELFDQLDFDLEDALARETRISATLNTIDAEMAAARARLEALGVSVPIPQTKATFEPVSSDGAPTRSRYSIPTVAAPENFGELTALAEARLDELGIDLTRDPLQQVLPSSQIAASLRAYADEHGDISWDETDWAVVIGAGALATILDIILVRIPQDSTFLGKKYEGSPLTKWLKDKERSKEIHERFFQSLERKAKVPYDASTSKATNYLVSKMRPATHRLQSFGHDPLLGFLTGVADIMHGTGTYVDGAGRLVQVATGADPVALTAALLTQVRHLLSDLWTPAGVPPPLFSLLQLGQVDSPFVLGPSGVKVTWTDVARYMYTNGYDLRHFITMGITPAIVNATIVGYSLLKSYATVGTKVDRKRERAKLTSMLLLGNTIATSGTLIKTGLIFGMNPAALNYTQILAMAPALTAWIKEATERDHRIRRALDAEWESLLIHAE